MRRDKGKICIFIFIITLSVFGAELFGADFYLLPEVIGTSDNPRLGNFILSLTGTENTEMRTCPLGLTISGPAVIPANTIKKRMNAVMYEDFILVGSYTVYLPHTVYENNRESKAVWLRILNLAARKIDLSSAWIEFNTDIAGSLSRNITDSCTTFHLKDDTIGIITYVKEGRKEEIRIVIKRFVSALETVRSIRLGKNIDSDDVSEKYIEISSNKVYLSADSLQEDFVASTYLSAGKVLTEGDIKKENIIQAGERISIIINRQPIYMKLEGISFGAGGEGDWVRVKPVRSDRSLYGKVLSRGEVYVEDF